jgi:hypothetical protein
MTYLDVNYPTRDPQTRAMQDHFYYLAVTPHFLVSAPRRSLLHEMVERAESSGTASSPAGIFADPEYSRLRALLPESLSSLNAGDFALIPMDKMVAQYKKQTEQSKTANTPSAAYLDLLQPEVITRHLRMAIGGSWKNASGIYFDSYVQ